MRIQDRTGIFRMELCADIPFQSRYFNDFHQVTLRITTYTLHSCLFILLFIIVIEFITMTVAFLYMFLVVDTKCARTLFQYTFISSQTHRPAHVCDILLVLHDIYDIMFCLFIHFATVGIIITENVTGKFDNHHLHTETDTECRYIMCTGIMRSDDFAFYTALTESRTDYDTVHILQLVPDILLVKFFTIDK